MDNYQEALTYLDSLVNYEQLPSRAGLRERRLERMAALLEALGNPHERFHAIHVAGTKGKGSVSAMCYAVLRHCGVPIGLYTSPHVMNIRERIRITPDSAASDWIDEQTFALGMTRVRDAIERTTPQHGPVTYFEALTALACERFAAAGVQWAVLEVGLGGRLDATNVIAAPVAVITPISLDHTDVLGHTPEAIAREKAGIIKPRQAVISMLQEPAVVAVLAHVCAEQSARLLRQGREFAVEYEAITLQGCTFHLRSPSADYADLMVPLLGRHQADNAAAAVVALEAVTACEPALPLTLAAIREGLAHVAWPGRGELIPTDPPVLLDGAHNAASGVALRELVRELFPRARVGLVLGMSRDKDVEGLCEALRPIVACARATQADHPRALPAAELALRMRVAFPSVEAVPHAGEAIASAHEAGCDVVVVTGSLFLVGEVRQHVTALTG